MSTDPKDWSSRAYGRVIGAGVGIPERKAYAALIDAVNLLVTAPPETRESFIAPLKAALDAVPARLPRAGHKGPPSLAELRARGVRMTMMGPMWEDMYLAALVKGDYVDSKLRAYATCEGRPRWPRPGEEP